MKTAEDDADHDEDRMETSNRLSLPDRLAIFGNDWNDLDNHMETRLIQSKCVCRSFSRIS